MSSPPSPLSGTIHQLLELALHTERQYERYYRGLARKFQRYPDVEGFWRNYAAEEQGHTRWLEALYDRTSDDVLNQSADREIMRQAARTAAMDVDHLLKTTTDLQIAFEMANELEHNETNTIFEFLIGYFTRDLRAQAFLRSQLRDHVNRLMMEFPEAYRLSSIRMGIRAE